ncbi:MAG: NADH-quinone oxidoreductase subunit J [candidate division Zixibacteria bacterium]|nr:NADH-quinone oxidoreductase subunit J [candidate division Zixibacteria bacterium]
MQLAIFIIFAVLGITGAILVISMRSPIASAIALIFVLCNIAGMFALMGALFIAALQVIVYAGAIMVLFLFIIMLLNIKEEIISPSEKKFSRVLGTVLGFAFLFEIGYFVNRAILEGSSGMQESIPSDFASIALVSESLFTKYLFAFEITSVLLLVAIVGAIMLSKGEGRAEN